RPGHPRLGARLVGRLRSAIAKVLKNCIRLALPVFTVPFARALDLVKYSVGGVPHVLEFHPVCQTGREALRTDHNVKQKSRGVLWRPLRAACPTSSPRSTVPGRRRVTAASAS